MVLFDKSAETFMEHMKKTWIMYLTQF